jgi:hypothetical protein
MIWAAVSVDRRPVRHVLGVAPFEGVNEAEYPLWPFHEVQVVEGFVLVRRRIDDQLGEVQPQEVSQPGVILVVGLDVTQHQRLEISCHDGGNEQWSSESNPNLFVGKDEDRVAPLDGLVPDTHD